MGWWTALGVICTALGVITALAIALGGAFFPKWSKYCARPKLDILYTRVAEFSSTVNGAYWLRVPIYNDGKSEAKNVEIFLEGFAKVSTTNVEPVFGTVPMRLLWCHTEQPSCPSIPAKSFRLLHLGSVGTQASTSVHGDTFTISFPAFELGGEVPTAAHSPLALGSFEIAATISADGVPSELLRFRVIVRKIGVQEGYPAKIEKV